MNKMKNIDLMATPALALAFAAFFSVPASAQMLVVEETETVSVTEIEPQLNNTGRLSGRLSSAMSRLEKGTHDVEKSYNDFKAKLAKDYGLQFSLDVSMMGQKGVPNGGKTATQSIYAPMLSWQMFNNDFGSGTINASYTAVRYWGNTAANIGNDLFVANPINDFTTESNSFDQLSYTQTMFDNKLSVTVGQFPLYDFDGTQYDSNQQVNFINYALSQNASETYPIAGLGAYVQFNPNSDWSFTVGMQNARNVTGQTLSGKGWGDKRFTTFGSISYTPTINGQSGQYSVMVYNQPNVETQPGNSVGWSVNLSQNITEKWGVFMRANAATGNAMPVSQSYVVGGVLNDPMNRDSQDQIGLAMAYNKVDKTFFNTATPMRRFESVVETYWNIGITQFFSIAPDIQLYVHPASKTDRDFGTVFSLRGTFQF